MSNASAGESFADLFENSLRQIKEGELVKGTVLSIDDEHVAIDIGFKSEGMVASWEFMDEDGTMLVGPGDEVDVLLEEAEGEDGRVVISKE
jgi:small subunit ribosomal protein S1